MPGAIWSLFIILTLDGWAEIVEPVIRDGGFLWTCFFLLFIVLLHFGLLNLIIGIIVEETMEAATQRSETISKLQDKERQRTLKLLKSLFQDMDKDSSGSLTVDEFMLATKLPDVEEKFGRLNIGVSELDWLFEVLDATGDGTLSITEFVAGCLRLTGMAKSRDLFQIYVHLVALGRDLQTQQAEEKQNTQEHRESSTSRIARLEERTTGISKALSQMSKDQAQMNRTLKLLADSVVVPGDAGQSLEVFSTGTPRTSSPSLGTGGDRGRGPPPLKGDLGNGLAGLDEAASPAPNRQPSLSPSEAPSGVSRLTVGAMNFSIQSDLRARRGSQDRSGPLAAGGKRRSSAQFHSSPPAC